MTLIWYSNYKLYCWLQWLCNDFIGYLAEWESEVASMAGLKQGERQKLTLSRETMDGLKITGM